jgi:phosphoglycolate phosphatase
MVSESSKKNNIRAVIFDVDGTLVNVEERFFHYYSETLESHGIEPLDRDVYEHKRRHGVLSDPVPDDVQTRAKFWLEFIDRFSVAEFEDLGRPFPGVPEALDKLNKRGYPLAIVTGRNSDPERVMEELEQMDISRYFQLVLTNDDGIRGLNKAAKLIQCARALGCDVSECAYVGDWEGDVESAREAKIGLMVAVLTGGEGREALEKSGPDVILDSVADLPKYLDGE